jgi:hypothetical protein
MSFLVESEPLAFFEIANFWLQSAYVQADSAPHEEYFTSVYAYILQFIEHNQNVAHYDVDSFRRWIRFVARLPPHRDANAISEHV